MRIRCKESSWNTPRTGLGAVGRTTREREKVEFGSTHVKQRMWKRELRRRDKTRTLKTEGCGTPVQTSQRSAASRREVSGSREGTNSWATYPLKLVTAMPRMTPSH